MMDFKDFYVEYSEKYGLADEEWDNLKKNVILSFYEDGGKVMSKHRGMPVFRHKTSESKIQAGETWICSLDSKQTYYFANALQRIDSSFMYELKKDQIDAIADVVWKEQRQIIEPMLEEKYKDVMNEQISAAVEKERKEFVDQIDTLKESISDLEQKDAENKQIIASLTDKINKAQTQRPERDANSVSASPFVSDQTMEIHVNRDGPDTISSSTFDRARYFVHLSADHRTLVIRPHDSGNVVCMDNSMTLHGLNLVSPFDVPCELISEYSPKYGGILIYL